MKRRRLARLLAMALALLVSMGGVAEEATDGEVVFTAPVDEAVPMADGMGEIGPEAAELPPAAEPAEPSPEREPEATDEPLPEEAPEATDETPEAPAGEALGAPVPGVDMSQEGAAEQVFAEIVAGGLVNESLPADLLLGVGERWQADAAALLGADRTVLGWFSTHPEVASVELLTGVVAAEALGRSEIVVVADDSTAAILRVEVLKAPTKVRLSPKKLALNPGMTGALAVTLPSGSASAQMTFASSDAAVCTVDARGVVTGVRAGGATITATAFNGASAKCAVAVLDGAAPTALSLDVKSLKLGEGEKRVLKPSVGGGEAAAYTFSSSDRAVATVSAAGKVTARGQGSAKITVKTHNGLQKTVKVKVVKAPTSVKLSAKKLAMNVGQLDALTAKLSRGSASKLRWRSSDKRVVSVGADGALTPRGAGVATITVKTFNGLTATCTVTVLAGRMPTSLALEASHKLGVGEQVTLAPTLGRGEEAVFRFSSADKSVAKVSAQGVVTARKRGTTTITVRTHNGMEASTTVKVVKAPTSVALSASEIELNVGETTTLKATLPGGGSSAITWASDSADIASVDAKGGVKALRAGTAEITASTYNGLTATCVVTVRAEEPEDTPAQQRQRMLDNLRADDSLGLGGKRDAVVGVVGVLMDGGFEPAFAAGVAANVLSEGTYGLFESSKYVSHPEKRPRYFAYLDGGDYYSKRDGDYVLTDVYLSPEEYDAYSGDAEKHLRFGDKDYYLDNFSKKYAWEVDLYELEALLQTLSDGGWQGKFGLGVVQWTGGRTKKLVEYYRSHAGSSADITQAQAVAAENEMILGELNGSYRFVYNTWLSWCSGDTDTPDAAREAGSLFCLKYEVPADKETKAIQRGAKAAAIYRVMIGE